MCSVKTVGRKSCSGSGLSLAVSKLRDLITVRLSVRFFVAGTSTTLLDGRWNGKKEIEREFRKDTTLTSSCKELQHHIKIIQDSRQ
jgi:hypothetical protein